MTHRALPDLGVEAFVLLCREGPVVPTGGADGLGEWGFDQHRVITHLFFAKFIFSVRLIPRSGVEPDLISRCTGSVWEGKPYGPGAPIAEE